MMRVTINLYGEKLALSFTNSKFELKTQWDPKFTATPIMSRLCARS